MDREQTTAAYLLDQCARYPALELQDLLKALYQSVFGCGHLLTEKAAERLRAELAALPRQASGEVEPLDGPFRRVHLGYLKESGLSEKTLFRLFALSAETPGGGPGELEEKLAVLCSLAEAGRLPFPPGETAEAVAAWRRAGFPACHHSNAFRAAYAPAYRVVRKDLAWALPLLAAIDRRLAEGGRLLLAIDGGSASGKTTLGTLLARVYDCHVFHMDDFFLRPCQRTAERLAEPGGNVDRERFLDEVLLPLSRGEMVRYRRYDCHTQTLEAAVEVLPRKLNVVEGAYSLHPALAGYYGLTAFLRIPPAVQRVRILARNGTGVGERFFTQWIPLEERYFAALDPAGRCDVILEVEE
ncbi:uridine kinase [uncultured Dysosmobacter sp.]|uniref:uridine kinase family protein n=1 Tax=uncultured Dysosmobacter sp. TaxID=2591384 RepID=UPI00261EE6B4|nr:hypothetical protein [uncultured Dysosmobacter sp.]